MATEKRLSGDLLFGLQIILSLGFITPQIIKGFAGYGTITWPLFCFVYVFFNVLLAVGAHKEKRSRKSWQLLGIYSTFSVFWMVYLLVLLFKVPWSEKDTVITICVLACIVFILFTRKKGTMFATITDPITRGWLSFAIKSSLQIYLAYRILTSGSRAELALTSLLVGHITVSLRLVEIYIAARTDGWNQHYKGMFWGEFGNELTWCFTTMVWFLV